MQTKADKKKDEAIENIKESIKLLSEIIIEEDSGYDDYNEAYKYKLKEAFNQLITIRDKIGG